MHHRSSRPLLLLLLTLTLSVALPLSRAKPARSAVLPASVDSAASPSCESCVDAVALLTRTLVADTSTLTEAMQDQLCPGAADEQQCRRSMRRVLPVLLTVFKSSANTRSLCSAPTACGDGLLGLSGYSLLGLPPTGPSQAGPGLQGGPTCALCTFLVNRLKLLLNDTSVQHTILDMADRVCSTLPKEFSQSCEDFVQTYEPLLNSWIMAIDSTEMCFVAGVCLWDQSGEAPRARPQAQLLHLPPTLAAALGRLHRVLAGGCGANDVCDVCEMAVSEAHSIVANPDTQAALINYTKSLCAYAGGPFNQECRDLVDTYSPDLFTYLEALLDPAELCTQLGVCKPTSLQQRWQQQAQRLASKLQGGAEQAAAALEQRVRQQAQLLASKLQGGAGRAASSLQRWRQQAQLLASRLQAGAGQQAAGASSHTQQQDDDDRSGQPHGAQS